ncbi:MAG: methionyl-tRNA formyltransferase [Alphaproteobacteria bacterium]|nr:methionyl-tRNA formyltransferase [Alphaproteobacteria bacterium]
MALRLVFMGTPDFAVPTFTELIIGPHEIACVYTQPPRRKGRGLAEEKSPVHVLAERHGLTVRTPVSLRSTDEQAAFAALAPDAAVVVAYGLLLPRVVLNAPRLGCFNLHASLLPRWRGAAPIQRAIMAGDKKTGVMVMRMEEGLDTGPVLMGEQLAVARKTYGELHDELKLTGAGLMARALAALEAGQVSETPQPAEGATYARKIENAETRIDWSRPAHALDCLIRGLSPRPGAWFEYRGERIKILFAEPVQGRGAPGEVLDGAMIACGEGALKPVSVQRAGRGKTDWDSFLRGFSLQRGERLG